VVQELVIRYGSSMAATISFYFDFISPYAYIGWKQIHAIARAHDREVVPVPILFAAILNANDTKGPAEIPSKRLYVFKDAFRRAAAQAIPLGPPPAHPFNPLLALRIASLPLEAAAQRLVIDTLFAAVWGGNGPGVTEPEVVATLLTRAGLDGASLVERAAGSDAKEAVRVATESAVTRGVFGVPSFDVDGEIFWGTDAFPFVEARLAGRDVIDSLDLSIWRDLPAQAHRKPSRD
jgi:2-hydroxychromene-2-carboxylate isomerase